MNKNRLTTKSGTMTILFLGAHPDDTEFRASGTAARWAQAGNEVVIVSVTDGRSGHHLMKPEEVAARRRKEAAEAAGRIGAESRILGIPDGSLEPTLENREKIIRLVREVKPDVIVTNRPNDYHPDHRYMSLLVQDSAYMFMVPHVVPDSEPLQYNPIIFYWADAFEYPRPFAPAVVIDIDPVIGDKLDMLGKHESQLFEWLPWVERYPDPIPQDQGKRKAWLERYYKHRFVPTIADRYRTFLVERYGEKHGNAVVEAEAFEPCEYGTRPDAGQLAEVFEGL